MRLAFWLTCAVCAGLLASAAIAAPAASPTGAPLPTVLLSRQLLKDAGARVGDVITLATDARGTRPRQFRVAGVYEPTANPMKFSVRRLEARLHLPDLIELAESPDDAPARDAVDVFHVAVRPGADSAAVADAISTRMPQLTAKPTSAETEQGLIFGVIDRFHRAIAVVTVVGSTAFLLALMVIRADERREMIGTLRLLGVPPRSIVREVLLEGLFIAAAGAVIGIVVALVGAAVINRFFQWRYDTTLRFATVTPALVWQAVGFAVPLGVVAGAAASWALIRRDVLTLVRR